MGVKHRRVMGLRRKVYHVLAIPMIGEGTVRRPRDSVIGYPAKAGITSWPNSLRDLVDCSKGMGPKRWLAQKMS